MCGTSIVRPPALADAKDAVVVVKEKKKEKRRNSEKRKVKSRDAARCRRGKESEIFNEMLSYLPLADDVASQLDKMSILRLALNSLRLNKFMEPANDQPSVVQEDKLLRFGPTENALCQDPIIDLMGGFLMILIDDGENLEPIFISEGVHSEMGLAPAELLGVPLEGFVHPCDYQELRDVFADLQDVEKQKQRRTLQIRMKCTITAKGRVVNIKSAAYKVVKYQVRLVKREKRSYLTAVCEPMGPYMAKLRPTKTTFFSSDVKSGSDFISHHDLKFGFKNVEGLPACFGYSPDDLRGQSLYNIIHPEDMTNLVDHFRELFSKGYCDTGFYRFLASRGGFCWVSTRAQLVQDTYGKPLTVHCVHSVLGGICFPGDVLAQFQKCAYENDQSSVSVTQQMCCPTTTTTTTLVVRQSTSSSNRVGRSVVEPASNVNSDSRNGVDGSSGSSSSNNHVEIAHSMPPLSEQQQQQQQQQQRAVVDTSSSSSASSSTSASSSSSSATTGSRHVLIFVPSGSGCRVDGSALGGQPANCAGAWVAPSVPGRHIGGRPLPTAAGEGAPLPVICPLPTMASLSSAATAAAAAAAAFCAEAGGDDDGGLCSGNGSGSGQENPAAVAAAAAAAAALVGQSKNNQLDNNNSSEQTGCSGSLSSPLPLPLSSSSYWLTTSGDSCCSTSSSSCSSNSGRQRQQQPQQRSVLSGVEERRQQIQCSNQETASSAASSAVVAILPQPLPLPPLVVSELESKNPVVDEVPPILAGGGGPDLSREQRPTAAAAAPRTGVAEPSCSARGDGDGNGDDDGDDGAAALNNSSNNNNNNNNNSCSSSSSNRCGRSSSRSNSSSSRARVASVVDNSQIELDDSFEADLLSFCSLAVGGEGYNTTSAITNTTTTTTTTATTTNSTATTKSTIEATGVSSVPIVVVSPPLPSIAVGAAAATATTAAITDVSRRTSTTDICNAVQDCSDLYGDDNDAEDDDDALPHLEPAEADCVPDLVSSADEEDSCYRGTGVTLTSHPPSYHTAAVAAAEATAAEAEVGAAALQSPESPPPPLLEPLAESDLFETPGVQLFEEQVRRELLLTQAATAQVQQQQQQQQLSDESSGAPGTDVGGGDIAWYRRDERELTSQVLSPKTSATSFERALTGIDRFLSSQREQPPAATATTVATAATATPRRRRPGKHGYHDKQTRRLSRYEHQQNHDLSVGAADKGDAYRRNINGRPRRRPRPNSVNSSSCNSTDNEEDADDDDDEDDNNNNRNHIEQQQQQQQQQQQEKKEENQHRKNESCKRRKLWPGGSLIPSCCAGTRLDDNGGVSCPGVGCSSSSSCPEPSCVGGDLGVITITNGTAIAPVHSASAVAAADAAVVQDSGEQHQQLPPLEVEVSCGGAPDVNTATIVSTSTLSVFTPRTDEMSPGFLQIKGGQVLTCEEPGLDLTHLAPTAGDGAMPLDVEFEINEIPENLFPNLLDSAGCSPLSSSPTYDDPLLGCGDLPPALLDDLSDNLQLETDHLLLPTDWPLAGSTNSCGSSSSNSSSSSHSSSNSGSGANSSCSRSHSSSNRGLEVVHQILNCGLRSSPPPGSVLLAQRDHGKFDCGRATTTTTAPAAAAAATTATSFRNCTNDDSSSHSNSTNRCSNSISNNSPRSNSSSSGSSVTTTNGSSCSNSSSSSRTNSNNSGGTNSHSPSGSSSSNNSPSASPNVKCNSTVHAQMLSKPMLAALLQSDLVPSSVSAKQRAMVHDWGGTSQPLPDSLDTVHQHQSTKQHSTITSSSSSSTTAAAPAASSTSGCRSSTISNSTSTAAAPASAGGGYSPIKFIPQKVQSPLTINALKRPFSINQRHHQQQQQHVHHHGHHHHHHHQQQQQQQQQQQHQQATSDDHATTRTVAPSFAPLKRRKTTDSELQPKPVDKSSSVLMKLLVSGEDLPNGYSCRVLHPRHDERGDGSGDGFQDSSIAAAAATIGERSKAELRSAQDFLCSLASQLDHAPGSVGSDASDFCHLLSSDDDLFMALTAVTQQ